MSQAGRRPARLGPGWVLFSVLFAAQASILVLSPILPQVADEFGVTTATAAQLRSVAGVTAGLAALVLATIGNRLSLSGLLNGGLAMLAIGAVAGAAAPTFAVLLGVHVVIGLGLAAVLSGGLAASETWAGSQERSKVLSWALIGQPVAWIVGQPVVGLVADADWRWSWVAVPFASAVAALAAVALRDRSAGNDGRRCDPAGLWRRPGIKPWAVAELFAFTGWGGALVYAGAVFIEAYGLSVSTTGLVLGFGAAFYLPGNFLGRRMLSHGAGILMTVFALAAAVGVGIQFGPGAGLAMAVVGFSLAVFFVGGRTIAGAATGLQISDGRRLAAMSVRTAAAQFGYLLGAAVGGILLDRWGFSGLAWGLGSILAASGLVHLPATARRSELVRTAASFLRRGTTG